MSSVNLPQLFANTNKLTIFYKRLNQFWDDHDFVESLTILKCIQDRNYEASKEIESLIAKMKLEINENIYQKPEINGEKIYLLLFDLLEVIEYNIELYKSYEGKFVDIKSSALFEKVKNEICARWEFAQEEVQLKKTSRKSSELTSEELDQFSDEKTLYELDRKRAFIYMKNWFHVIYEHSFNIHQYIQRFNPNKRKFELDNDKLGFESYLTERGQKIYEMLKEKYTNSKPRVIGCMLYALNEMDLLKIPLETLNRSDLHKALQYSFVKIGVLKSLNNTITMLIAASNTSHFLIEQQREFITKMLKRVE